MFVKKILVRIDDVCQFSNKEKLDKCIRLVERYGIKPLLGVIPNCEDTSIGTYEGEGIWEYITRQYECGCPIAMHGYKHVYTSKAKGLVSWRPVSEFAGVEYDIQCRMIYQGKKILENHSLITDIFFAPAHSYDKNTLRALKENGFKTLSDGRTARPYLYEGIIHIPAEAAHRFHIGGGIVTVCLHTNAMSEVDYKKLENYLERNKANLVQWNVVIENAAKCRKKNYLIVRAEEIVRMMVNKVIINITRILLH